MGVALDDPSRACLYLQLRGWRSGRLVPGWKHHHELELVFEQALSLEQIASVAGSGTTMCHRKTLDGYCQPQKYRSASSREEANRNTGAVAEPLFGFLTSVLIFVLFQLLGQLRTIKFEASRSFGAPPWESFARHSSSGVILRSNVGISRCSVCPMKSKAHSNKCSLRGHENPACRPTSAKFSTACLTVATEKIRQNGFFLHAHLQACAGAGAMSSLRPGP